MPGLRILKAGPLTLVQDKGRLGQQHLGLSQGGAMDTHARFWANHLLSNTENSAVLEIAFGPFSAEFMQPTVFSICGADLPCTINQKPVGNWRSHRVKAGDSIELQPGDKGVRAYLAVKNGFITPLFFGSRSEVPREKLVPSQVYDHAILPYEKQHTANQITALTPKRFIPNYQDDLILRVIPSFQYKQFTQQALDVLSRNAFTLSPQSNRMGYLIKGERIVWEGEDILSQPVPLGSIQIPPDGQAIVLLNDRQTIGGYPIPGCVCAMDCAQLSQRRGGQKIRFAFIRIESLIPGCGVHP